MSRHATIADLLCEQVRKLRAMHRTGITPPFGELDRLFELGQQLEESVMLLPESAFQASPVETRACSAPGCASTRLRAWRTVNGHDYCEAHGLQVQHTLSALGRLVPQAHAAAVREMGGAK